jgi:hypothetical protein
MEMEQKSQLERANETLLRLAASVSASDRKEAITELGFTELTIINYLKGRGKKVDTGVKLIEFFKKRIEKRERLIA